MRISEGKVMAGEAKSNQILKKIICKKKTKKWMMQ